MPGKVEMKIHVLQHVTFENEANIGAWADARGHTINRSLLYEREIYPPADEFDWLVVMGGPMNVDDEERYPWLGSEKKFIENAISDDKLVLGICLGAQLIARVLGAPVRKGLFKEIGWFPVKLTEAAAMSGIVKNLPPELMAFHWHGDMFEIPGGAMRLAESKGCPNQAFQFGSRVLGLQFHLESGRDSILELMKHEEAGMREGPFTQTDRQIRAGMNHLEEMNRCLAAILDGMAAEVKLTGVKAERTES